jgi:hypothetical protein
MTAHTDYIAPLRTPVAYGEYAGYTPEQIKAVAFAKLQARIEAGQKRAQVAVGRVLGEEIVDRVIPANLVRFNDDIEMVVGDARYPAADHALKQLASRYGFPGRYLTDLRGSAWGKKLVSENLNALAEHHAEGDKFLVRRVGDQVRGVLSDNYRADDSRPAIDALIGIARDFGAIVADGTALDTKTSVKILIAEPVEVFPGEWAVFGADYRTSDFGDGARELCGFIERLLCLNGATVTTNFRRVHLGKKIADEAEYSAKTRRLNDQFTASATRDMARALLGPESIRKMIEQLRVNHAAGISPDQIKAELKTTVNKGDEKAIIDAFNSADVHMMPAGQTRWRFSNAISFLATQKDDAREKLDLERLAGNVLVPVPAAA